MKGITTDDLKNKSDLGSVDFIYSVCDSSLSQSNISKVAVEMIKVDNLCCLL